MSLSLACSMVLSPSSIAAGCDPFVEVESEYRAQLDEIVRELDEQTAESYAAARDLLRQGGWDGRAESLQFDDEGMVEYEFSEELRPLFEQAQAEAARVNTDRLIEVRRLQQIDFINVALAVTEELATDSHSSIEPFSARADALELLRQTLDRVGIGHLPESYDAGSVACDLSSAIRARSIRKRTELESDPGFHSRITEFVEFSAEFANEIESDSLSGNLKERYQSLHSSIENDVQQMRFVHYMWLLAALNDMSVVIRDSNLVDADRFDGDPSKLGLYIDEQREQGEISSLEWEIGRHWVLLNRKYDLNDYDYGEFSGWQRRSR